MPGPMPGMIRLTSYKGETVDVKPQLISSLVRHESVTIVREGGSYLSTVKETPDEIGDLARKLEAKNHKPEKSYTRSIDEEDRVTDIVQQVVDLADDIFAPEE